MAEFTCPACGAPSPEVVHTEESIPVNSCLLLESEREAAAFPRGRMELAICHACGFLTNRAFDPGMSEYSSRYEETQGFSARFNAFARDLAKRWVDKHDLHGKSVLEIGCGKGEFLVMMAEAGIGEGIGIDPSAHPERLESEAASRIRWITDFYSEAYTDLAADAIVCRHTLEHIAPVGDFMRMVRRSIGDRTDTVVLFELPDVRRVLEEVAFWDVYYEHCSYFSAGSLARLFRATGFEVLDIELDYDDQYLLIEARPSTTPAPGSPLPIEDDLEVLRAAAASFGATYADKVASWREDVRRATAGGGTAVIWGGGSKGVAYLTAMDLPEIRYVVDINPYKHDRYMAGSGLQVVAPSFLVDLQPELVVAMNPIYTEEIQRELDSLGVKAALTAV